MTKTERNLQSGGSCPSCLQQTEMGLAESKNPESVPFGSFKLVAGTQLLNHRLLLPRYSLTERWKRNREQEHKHEKSFVYYVLKINKVSGLIEIWGEKEVFHQKSERKKWEVI